MLEDFVETGFGFTRAADILAKALRADPRCTGLTLFTAAGYWFSPALARAASHGGEHQETCH
jgi:hypothetical protein